MVESVDDATGRILSTLDELKLTERTMILFTSDNGGLDRNGRPTDNAPLRSGKGYPYEGGIRVPFLVRWPGVVEPQVVSDKPVCSIDIFPTLLEAAEIRPLVNHVIDGRSLVDHLKSGGKKGLDRRELYWHFPHYRHAPGPYSIIRRDNYKLIKFHASGFELFDLAKDLGETTNLAEQMPQKVQELDERLLLALDSMNAKLPRPNPAYKPPGKNR